MGMIIKAFILTTSVFFYVIKIMGAILFIPVLLLMAAIGTPTRTTRQSSSTATQEDYDMHLPLLKMPPEYHEAYALYLINHPSGDHSKNSS